MTVYVAYETYVNWSESSTHIIGVFATLEDAQAACPGKAKWASYATNEWNRSAPQPHTEQDIQACQIGESWLA